VGPVGYADLLEQVKVRVRTSRVQAARAVNTELGGLYWQIGPLIIDRQESEGWGSPCPVAGWLLAHDTVRPPIRNRAQHRTVVRLSVCDITNIIFVASSQNEPHRPGSRWTQLGIKAWQLGFQHIKLLAYMH